MPQIAVLVLVRARDLPVLQEENCSAVQLPFQRKILLLDINNTPEEQLLQVETGAVPGTEKSQLAGSTAINPRY